MYNVRANSSAMHYFRNTHKNFRGATGTYSLESPNPFLRQVRLRLPLMNKAKRIVSRYDVFNARFKARLLGKFRSKTLTKRLRLLVKQRVVSSEHLLSRLRLIVPNSRDSVNFLINILDAGTVRKNKVYPRRGIYFNKTSSDYLAESLNTAAEKPRQLIQCSATNFLLRQDVIRRYVMKRYKS